MRCPTDDEREQFLRGDTPGKRFEVMESHFESCPSCQRALQRLSDDDTHVAPPPIDRLWNDELCRRLAAGVGAANDDLEETVFGFPSRLGDYELPRPVGRGGMGVVFEARQRKLNRIVALKVMSGQLLNPSLLSRFEMEVRSAAKLNHPGIVPIYDVGDSGPYLYFSMEYLRGGSLDRSPLPSTPADVARLVKSVAESVQYAHDCGIIHRDLKPANILLDDQGAPRIADFGLAKNLIAGNELTATNEVLGTPSYMSPEQASSESETTAAADVYGLGGILFFLLTGRAPFEGGNAVEVLEQVKHREARFPQEIREKLPRDLETITLMCLAKQPEQRYASANEVARELERFLNREPIVARPLGLLSRWQRWCIRHPAIAALSTLALLFLLVGAVVSGYFGLLANRNAGQARASAQNAREQADVAMQILESTLYDLQSIVLDDPAKQQQRRTLLQSVLSGLEGMDPRHVQSDRLMRCRATAVLGLADVVNEIGDGSDSIGVTTAEPYYKEAIRCFGELVESRPDDNVAKRDLVEAYVGYGDVLAEAARWKEAHQHFVAAMPMSEALASVTPDDAKIQGRWIQLQVFVAECLHQQRKLEEAGRLLRSAQKQSRIMKQRFPDDAFIQGETIHVSVELGDWYLSRKQFDAAEACYRELQAAATEIVRQRPGDSPALMDLSSAHERIGDVLLRVGQLEPALQEYERSLAVGVEAGNLAPNNHHTQWEVSFSYQKLADAFIKAGRYAEAQEMAHSCVEIRKTLADRDADRHAVGLWMELSGRLEAVKLSEVLSDVSKRVEPMCAVVDSASTEQVTCCSRIIEIDFGRAVITAL